MSIADPNEVWILEIIGKGPGNKGAVWVAQRLPDDCISAHANQARITTIPFNDKENCMYSPDVVSFAREKGYFTGKDSEFSFSGICDKDMITLLWPAADIDDGITGGSLQGATVGVILTKAGNG